MKQLRIEHIGSVEVVEIQSSQSIERIMWSHTKRQMMIKFKNSPVYVYPSAPYSLFKEFVSAESKGRFFLTNVKKQHPQFVRLDN